MTIGDRNLSAIRPLPCYEANPTAHPRCLKGTIVFITGSQGHALPQQKLYTRPKGGQPIGGPAALIEAPQLNGGTFRLADHKGRVVVLDFWATWCRPCRKTLPALQRVHEMYRDDQRVKIISVNVDEGKHQDGRVGAFMKKNRFDFTVVRDATGRWSQTYGIRTIPYLVIVDAQGRIHKRVQGRVGSTEVTIGFLKKGIEDAKADTES